MGQYRCWATSQEGQAFYSQYKVQLQYSTVQYSTVQYSTVQSKVGCTGHHMCH